MFPSFAVVSIVLVLEVLFFIIDSLPSEVLSTQSLVKH